MGGARQNEKMGRSSSMLADGKSSLMNSRVELVHVDWWEELVNE